MKCFQVFLVLMFCTVCRAQHIAQIESRSFYDPEHGIKQLIRSLELQNPAFFALDPKKRDAEFDRLGAVCVNEPQHKQDPVCRAFDDISVALEQFAKDREIVVLIDACYGNVATLYGQFNIGDAGDITLPFVEGYNRLHP